MPRPVRISLWLFIGSELAFLLIGFLDPRPLPVLPAEMRSTLIASVVVFFVPFLGLFAFIAYRAYRGRNWARWALTAFLLIGGIKYIGFLASSFRQVPLIGILDGITVCCQVVALVLLFVPVANRWYRGYAQLGSAA